MSKDIISKVVDSFYTKMVADVFVGYQFRKIQEFTPENILDPGLGPFSNHLPRIKTFWANQLLGETIPSDLEPFNLIRSHQDLNLRECELGRFVTLFNATINSFENELGPTLYQGWLKKITHFEQIFTSAAEIFGCTQKQDSV